MGYCEIPHSFLLPQDPPPTRTLACILRPTQPPPSPLENSENTHVQCVFNQAEGGSRQFILIHLHSQPGHLISLPFQVAS